MDAARGRGMGIGGRANIDFNSRWMHLDHIWLAGFPFALECYRPCDFVMGAARGRGMGVGGRTNIDLGFRWIHFDEILHRLSSRPRKDDSLCSYVVGVVCGA